MKRKEKATWSVGFIIIIVIIRWDFLTVFFGGGVCFGDFYVCICLFNSQVTETQKGWG